MTAETVVDGAVFEPVTHRQHEKRLRRFNRMKCNAMEDRKLDDPAGRDGWFWTPDRTKSFINMWALGLAAQTIADQMGASRREVMAKASALGLLATHSAVRAPYDPTDPEQRRTAIARIMEAL